MIALLLAFAQTVPAPPPGAPRPQPEATVVASPLALLVAGLDADNDGRTTRAEFDAGLKRAFDAVAGGREDIGYIGYGDFTLRWMGSATALPGPYELDRDDDNRITRAELTAIYAERFRQLDADQDGTVTRAELLTVRTPQFDRRLLREDRRRR